MVGPEYVLVKPEEEYPVKSRIFLIKESHLFGWVETVASVNKINMRFS